MYFASEERGEVKMHPLSTQMHLGAQVRGGDVSVAQGTRAAARSERGGGASTIFLLRARPPPHRTTRPAEEGEARTTVEDQLPERR
jgi:hypothetical protein